MPFLVVLFPLFLFLLYHGWYVCMYAWMWA